MTNGKIEDDGDSTLELRCPSELVSKATYAAQPEDSGVFAMCLGPLPEDTIVELERPRRHTRPCGWRSASVRCCSTILCRSSARIRPRFASWARSARLPSCGATSANAEAARSALGS